jgi:hypothetical protein
MSVASYCRRFTELPQRDRGLLVEAVYNLAVASLAIKALPFRKVVGRAEREVSRLEPCSALPEVQIKRMVWAIEACARLLPWRTVCFQKGLALHWMLQRRGVRTVLHYGVAQDPERGLVAHVWVTQGEKAIIGAEEAPNFTCLASFPAAAPARRIGHSGESTPTHGL